MGRSVAATALALMALLVGGCARNAVTVERGGELVAIGMPVTAAARGVVRDVQAVNREAAIEIAVVDPRCDWKAIRIETAEPPPPGTIICGTGASSVPFTMIDEAAVRPTLTLVDALVAYLSAVDDVVSAAPDDSGTALALALTDLNALTGLAAGKTLLNDDQITAAEGLAGLIGALVQERNQVARLRLVERQAPDVAAIIDALDRDLNGWTRFSQPASLAAIDTAFGVRSMRLRRTMMEQPAAARTVAADDQYRGFLRQWAAIKDRQQAAQALPVEMQKAVAALRIAHQDYARILDPAARLTPADRAAMARVTRARLRQALSAVAGVLRAFL